MDGDAFTDTFKNLVYSFFPQFLYFPKSGRGKKMLGLPPPLPNPYPEPNEVVYITTLRNVLK
jgi:hypothetical protein